MFNKTIKARVMAAVNSKIAKAERDYATACGEIDKKKKADILALEAQSFQDKEDKAVKLVESIIGKLI